MTQTDSDARASPWFLRGPPARASTTPPLGAFQLLVGAVAFPTLKHLYPLPPMLSSAVTWSLRQHKAKRTIHAFNVYLQNFSCSIILSAVFVYLLKLEKFFAYKD